MNCPEGAREATLGCGLRPRNGIVIEHDFSDSHRPSSKLVGVGMPHALLDKVLGFTSYHKLHCKMKFFDSLTGRPAVPFLLRKILSNPIVFFAGKWYP